MLQSKLNECRVLMAEVSQNKQKDNEHQNTVKKNNTFFDAYTKVLLPIIRGYVVCKKYEHITFTDKTEEDLEKLIIYSKQTFDQKTVINPAKFKDKVNQLNIKIRKEWKEQTDEYLTSIIEELEILKLVSNNKQEITRILFCLKNFSNWPDEEMARQFEEANINAKELLSRMEFDDDISEFLKKVKNKEASLLDLTDPIITWIRRENLSGNIMLNIRN